VGGKGRGEAVMFGYPAKVALLALAYAAGYQFPVIYIVSAYAIYTLIGDNNR
jgi:hypothetical protein